MEVKLSGEGGRRPAPSVLFRLLFQSLWFSFFTLIFCLWYLWLTEPGTLPVTVNKALADTAMILIGCSFLLSSLCYFWDFVDCQIVYRKHLGLLGFALALAHGVMSLVFYLYYKPHGYETDPIFVLDHQWLIGSFFVSNLYAFAAALVAFVIFLMMTLISNRFAVHQLGGVWWRRLLRVGYLGYIAAALHFSIKNIPEWLVLSQTQGIILPPLNLFIFLLVCVVIGFRLTLWWSLRKKMQHEKESGVV